MTTVVRRRPADDELETEAVDNLVEAVMELRGDGMKRRRLGTC